MHPTRRIPRLMAALAIMLCTTATAGTAPDAARKVLDDAIHAMGGIKTLQGIERVHLTGHAYRNMLEQSERPAGPWIPDFSRIDQWVDFSARGVRTTRTDRSWGPAATSIVAGDVAARIVHPGKQDGKMRPGRQKAVRRAHVRLALGPERVLLTALAAGDLHLAPETKLQHVPQKVLAFTWHGAPVRLYLNAWTTLPTAMQITRPHPRDIFWNVWGDVTTRICYSFWVLKPGGLRYPRQWDIRRNGQPARTLFIDKLVLNPAPAGEQPVIAESVRKAFHQRADRTIDDFPLAGKAEHVAPGVMLFPGPWNTTLVVQDDGIVVLDAPIAPGYSRQVMRRAAQLFPGRPIKAVVTTSNAWPHVGGIREYVARGIPLYVLDLNLPFVKAVLDAPHNMQPDTLAMHPQAPRLHVVPGRTVIGNGATRIELYPVRGEAGERMMFAYFPGHKLLYASDMVQPGRNGGFAFPEYLFEVARVVAREGLDVERVFAMHTPQPVSWQVIRDAIARAGAPVAD